MHTAKRSMLEASTRYAGTTQNPRRVFSLLAGALYTQPVPRHLSPSCKHQPNCEALSVHFLYSTCRLVTFCKSTNLPPAGQALTAPLEDQSADGGGGAGEESYFQFAASSREVVVCSRACAGASKVRPVRAGIQPHKPRFIHANERGRDQVGIFILSFARFIQHYSCT